MLIELLAVESRQLELGPYVYCFSACCWDRPTSIAYLHVLNTVGSAVNALSRAGSWTFVTYLANVCSPSFALRGFNCVGLPRSNCSASAYRRVHPLFVVSSRHSGQKPILQALCVWPSPFPFGLRTHAWSFFHLEEQARCLRLLSTSVMSLGGAFGLSVKVMSLPTPLYELSVMSLSSPCSGLVLVVIGSPLAESGCSSVGPSAPLIATSFSLPPLPREQPSESAGVSERFASTSCTAGSVCDRFHHAPSEMLAPSWEHPAN